jgi:hypothetical protein
MQPSSALPVPSATDLVPVFLRMPTVMRVTGLSRSTIYRRGGPVFRNEPEWNPELAFVGWACSTQNLRLARLCIGPYRGLTSQDPGDKDVARSTIDEVAHENYLSIGLQRDPLGHVVTLAERDLKDAIRGAVLATIGTEAFVQAAVGIQARHDQVA